MGRSKRKAGSYDHEAQRKITKQKYAAHYQAAWTTGPEFTTWIRPVAEDRMGAFCRLCRTDFSVAASGIYDARAHAKGTHHKEKTAERGTVKSIQSLFTGQESIKVSLQMFTE
jgi:hypothetical protein